MSRRLVLRIQENFNTLSPGEQKLARLLVERGDEVFTFSATELSAQAGVSKSTGARLFKRLGYADFNEARLQAREERDLLQPFSTLDENRIGRSTTARTLPNHLQLELANLTRTFEETSPDQLAKAAAALVGAPRIWVAGFAEEAGLADYSTLLLSRIRPGVARLSANHLDLAEALAMVAPKDAVLAIAVDSRVDQIVPILKYARTSRAGAVLIGDNLTQKTALRHGALILPCHVSGRDLGPTHTAVLSMIRLLINRVAADIGKSANQRQELIEQIREELG